APLNPTTLTRTLPFVTKSPHPLPPLPTLSPYTTLFRSHIGAGSRVAANVVIYYGCVIGNNCAIASGSVIGADGFGYAEEQGRWRSEEHTSELQSREKLVCRLLLEKKKPMAHRALGCMFV